MNIFNILNRTTNLNINVSFKVTCKIKIIRNYSLIIYYKFLILIPEMQNFMGRIIIVLSIK